MEKNIENWFKNKFEKDWCGGKKWKKKNVVKTGGGGVYCVGVIGAAVYYISIAGSFWIGVLGFLKACVWPAFIVYELLQFMGVK